MTYRIWWLIAFCALGIGVAIETAPADAGAAGKPTASSAASTAVAARRAEGRGS